MASDTFTSEGIIFWVIIPTVITLIAFFVSLKFWKGFKGVNYVDTIYLACVAVLGVYPGFVHGFKGDGGLVDIAQMDQDTYDEYRGTLLFGYRFWGQLDLAVGLLYFYAIYFRNDFVLDLIIWDIILHSVKLIVSFTSLYDDEEENLQELVPDAPGQSADTGFLVMLAIWVVARVATSSKVKSMICGKKEDDKPTEDTELVDTRDGKQGGVVATTDV